MGWVPAGADYEVSVDRGKVVARTAQGKALRSLPKALKEHGAVTSVESIKPYRSAEGQLARLPVD